MYELAPFELDRELARVAPRLRAALRALHEGELERAYVVPELLLDPETLDRLQSDRSDPIAAPLLRWLYRLELSLRELPWERERLRLYRQERHAVDAPLAGHFTLRELLGQALRDAQRREPLLELYLERGGRMADATARRFEARAAFERFAGKSRDELELPCPTILKQARGFVALTDDGYSTLEIRSLPRLLEVGLSHAAADGWPRRLELRSLHALLGEPGWLSGLQLDPGQWPVPLAPASFLRGLARLGAAWNDALAPRSQPYSLAHDPFGLARRTHGALFALLPLTPSFLRRQLGLGKDRGRAHARALAQSLLCFARARALELELREPALSGPRALGEAFAEHTSRVLGVELPGAAAGVLFRPEPDAGQRFAGLLLAASRAAELAQAHDEDWFRNPRAIEQLRAEASIAPDCACSSEALAAGARELARRLNESF